MQRYNQRLIEEMKNKQTQERTRLPKIQRSEAKTRMAMFKKSLRITAVGISPEQERERVKQVRRWAGGLNTQQREQQQTVLCSQFAAQEERRQKNERLHQHQKHENQMRDLQLQCDANIRELQQLQVQTHASAPEGSALPGPSKLTGPCVLCRRTRSATCWSSTRRRS